MSDISPITREEMYYNEILGNDEDISPITRTEIWLDKIAKNTSSTEPEATSEGTYTDTISGSLFVKSIYGMSIQDGTPTPSDPVLIEDSLGNFTVTDSDATNTQTITTNITLRAIEVTSSDAYNLEYDGKYYIADSIDWVDGTGYVLTQRIDSYTVTGNETVSSADVGAAYQRFIIEDPLPANIGVFVSNAFLQGAGAGDTWGYARLVWVGNKAIIFGDAGSTHTFADETEFIAWMTANNPVFNVILATPTTSTLTTAQATALLGLSTYENSTTITGTSDPACLVEVEYGSSKLVNQVIKNKIDIALLKLED